MRLRRRVWIAALTLALLALPAAAHIGSPDVYFQGHAGPYALAVSVTTPAAIPGVAQISVIALGAAAAQVRSIGALPMALVGEGSKYPPQPAPLTAVAGARGSFRGPVWIMASGSMEIRLQVSGGWGAAELAVPLPASANRMLPMRPGLGRLLAALLLLLASSFVAVVAAAARQSTLAPGRVPTVRDRRRGRGAAVAAAAILLVVLAAGNHWWNLDARLQAETMLYRQPPFAVQFTAPDRLELRIGYSSWHDSRPAVLTALLPDHGHLMHLFLLREAANGVGTDALYHLHPTGGADGRFTDVPPSLPAGRYRVFADIVRVSGFAETLTATLDLPAITGSPLRGDDSEAIAGPQPSLVAPLPNGGKMIWERAPGPLPANQLLWFRFHVENPSGRPATDLEPYMGMASHAEIVRSDFSVFVHLHPDGSVSMVALNLANPGVAGMDMATPSPDLSFPYGFPRSGRYRVYVQIKRHGQVQTGVFDTVVN